MNLNQTSLNERQRTLLNSALKHLKPHWCEALERRRALWKSGTGRDAHIGVDGQIDLAPLEDFLGSIDEHTADSEEAFLDRVRREDYSAADLFIELLAAQEALPAALREASGGEDQTLALESWSEARMQDLFLRILEETSCVYESMAESGRRGYCQVDSDGRIVFANRGLRILCDGKDLRGQAFSELFGDDGVTILEMIRNANGRRSQALQIRLRNTDKTSIPVLVEFAPIPENRGVSGAYVAVTDLSEVRRPQREAQTKIFERASFGVVRSDRHRRILYANKAALDIFGVDDIDGWTLEDIPVTREERERLLERFEERMGGVSDTYEVMIRRKSDNREIPVSVTGIPEVAENNHIVGAFAIMHSRELEQSATRMRSAIETLKTIEEMLEAVADEISNLLDFDYVSMYVFSEDGLFSRPIFFKNMSEGDTRLITRWYESNEAVKQWREHENEWVIEDIETFLEEMDKEMLKHPDVQRMIDEGVRYWYNQPISIKGKQVAGIALGTREPATLARAQEVMKALPLSEATRMVFQLFELREQTFLVRLLRALHASKSAAQGANILTDELARHFQWDNVAIYRVDREKNLLRLVQQSSGPGPTGFLRDPGQEIPMDDTVALDAYESGEIRYENHVGNVSHVLTESVGKDTQSVLCKPLSVGDVTPWIVQIEDCQNMAFVQEDIEALERIFKEVVSILNDLSEHFQLRHVFLNASDAIITCRNNGDIVDVNGHAVTQFGGRSKADLKNRNIKDLFVETDVVEGILVAPTARQSLLAMGTEDEDEWNALVTSFRMPDGFDTNVLIIQDKDLLGRLAKLEKIHKLFDELAHHTRAPISLMHGALRRLSSETKPDEIAKFVEKTTAQLRKIELAQRQLYDDQENGDEHAFVQPMLIRADQMLIDRLVEGMPGSDREHITVEVDEDLPLLNVDVYRTDFVFSSILAHYLRFVPLDEKVRVEAQAVGRWIEVTIAATLPADVPMHSRDLDAKSFAARFTLENPLVRRYVDDLGGEFEPPSPPENMVCSVRLPHE